MSLDVNLSEPDEFNCSELHSCIESVARMKNINNFTYHVEFICGKGENYVANVFRVTIKDPEDSKLNLSVIVKTLVNTTRQELFRELHKREVNAYLHILSRFQSIQNKLCIEDRVVLPECVLSDTRISNEVLILEDLTSKGYAFDSKITKLQNLDKHKVCLILSELAKFHALSLVFEKDDTANFAKLKEEFEDLVFQESFLNNSRLKNYYTDSYEASISLVTNIEAKNQLQKAKSKLLELLRTFIRPRHCNVFCHGDYWINNFLFKEEDKICTKVCLLDFQAMRYSNPATDIIYFVYLCTDSQFRSKYLENCLTAYYDSFKTFLKLFDIDVHSVYPKELFEADIKYTLPFGLLIALVELRIVTNTLNEENITKEPISEYEEHKYDNSNENIFLAEKVNDVVKESLENGVIDRISYLIKYNK